MYKKAMTMLSFAPEPPVKGAMSDKDKARVQRKAQGIKDGQWRSPRFGGGLELLNLMNPETDDMENKLFNYCATLNIYSGLLVSGLINYVLEPQDPVAGDVTALGTTIARQELVNYQMFFSHINLVISALMFAHTTYACIFCVCETTIHSIPRCVSNAGGMWVHMLLSFIQMCLLVAQVCLAALINFYDDPRFPADAAVVILVVDAVVCILYVLYSQHVMWGPSGMFTLAGFDWLAIAPGNLLYYLIHGNTVPKRIGETLIADTRFHLGSDDAKKRLSAVQREREQREMQEQQLRSFLTSVLGYEMQDINRLDLAVKTMTDDGLTVDELTSTAACTDGPLLVYNALDLKLVELTRGERFKLVIAVVDMASASAKAGAPDTTADESSSPTPDTSARANAVNASETPNMPNVLRLTPETQIDQVTKPDAPRTDIVV